MNLLSSAEKVLQELGITDPWEINIEAIAWHLGVQVKFSDLDGCEARIIGYRGRAVVRVDRSARLRRQRFSIAHELGHWCHHRGRTLICRSSDIGSRKPGVPQIERVADTYAADLLMPRYLFDPITQSYSRLSFKAVQELVERFDTSLTATAIRVVEGGHTPALLVCHGLRGRKWFVRGPDVPSRWFPRDELDPESFAFELLYGKGPAQARPRLIGADAWFDRQGAGQYNLQEHSTRTTDGEILTLLLINEDGMLKE